MLHQGKLRPAQSLSRRLAGSAFAASIIVGCEAIALTDKNRARLVMSMESFLFAAIIALQAAR